MKTSTKEKLRSAIGKTKSLGLDDVTLTPSSITSGGPHDSDDAFTLE